MGRKSNLQKIHEKLFEEILPELIKEHTRNHGDPEGFIWIKSSVGEMICFSQDLKTMKQEISAMGLEK